ncbi:ferredoxin reductase [Mycolicibacterium sp. (ex Dasyatis americana)]|nr:ferredoxin reductase [Mycolicibacterium sp. (ex Dasyatis americana)]
MRSVLVIGGGIAGVSTVGALRAGGFDGKVTLIDAGEFPYDRPPLSKDYLCGKFDFKQIALQPAEWYDQNRIQLLTTTTVAALRSAEGGVELSDGTIARADRIVLATGGRAARPPIPGADSTRVHVLRTSDDADRLRDRLVPAARVLVVGAGLIGAEVASTAVDLGCEVVVVDPVALPLVDAVGADLAAWLHDLHRLRGIDTVRASVELLHDHSMGIRATLSGETMPRSFDVVVLGVGMAPETALAETAGLEVDRGVVVDTGQRTSHPAVLAVGDPTRVRRVGVLDSRVEHWDAAQQDGRRAAASILDTPAPPETAAWFWTDRHGRHVEVVGRMTDAEQTVIRGQFGADSFACFGLRAGRLVGAAAVDDAGAARAARRMIDRSFSVDPDRLVDTSVDLRKLLRS